MCVYMCVCVCICVKIIPLLRGLILSMYLHIQHISLSGRFYIYKLSKSEQERVKRSICKYICVVRLPLTALSSQANFTFCQRTVVWKERILDSVITSSTVADPIHSQSIFAVTNYAYEIDSTLLSYIIHVPFVFFNHCSVRSISNL